MLMCLWMGECPVSESPDIPPVPEPMEEGAAVDAAARALHDLFHEENETGLGPDDCRDECVSPPTIWRAAARAAIDAISYPALLAELTRQAAVVEAGVAFAEKHGRYHPDFWLAESREYATNGGYKSCDACTFCAALDTP